MYTEMTIQPREWNKCCQSVSGTPFWCNGGCPETDGQIDGGPLHVPSAPSTHGMGWDESARLLSSPLPSRSSCSSSLRRRASTKKLAPAPPLFPPASCLCIYLYHFLLKFIIIIIIVLLFSVPQPPQTSVRCWPSGSCIAALTVVELPLGRLLELVLYCGSLLGSSGTRWMKVGVCKDY
ncbi:hypothetical protein GE21DRAFT_1108727 [Neurospora crassa]|nr:hypothetical protein GE21DRAFT_1108727 [Neurospora crassa]